MEIFPDTISTLAFSYKRSFRSDSLYFLGCFNTSISPLIVCHSTTSSSQQNYQCQCLSQHHPNCRQSSSLAPTPPRLLPSKISCFWLHSLSCPPSSRSASEIQTALPLTRNAPQYRIPRSKGHRRKFSRTSCESLTSIELVLEQETGMIKDIDSGVRCSPLVLRSISS